ncbi:MAG TPA: F0F1 ATP synthase subunit B [Gemmatimonadales bacterium]|nr:F0F1 ATP synthase subunit B [Gemmatimonadales bacterium]
MKQSLWLALAATLVGAGPVVADEGQASGPLVVNGGLMIWTLVVFTLLFLVLRRFAWPALLGAVEAREKRLEEQIAEAERNRAESAKLLEQHKKLLADGRSQATALLAEARAAAERERALALEKTRQEQEELLERARREIASERERAVVELRREAVDLSLAAASKLIGERLTAESDRKLIESYLATLEPGK